ncbi:MAG: hypothetical protein ICV72_11860, partial [Aldersonia sp.]|nr:hypothetical protein [Aldersonia sp.]
MSDDTDTRDEERSEQDKADKKQSGGDSVPAEPTKEMVEKAEEDVADLQKKYEPGARPTVVLPGSDGTVSGTAFSDVVDENGEMKEDAEQGKDGHDQERDDQGRDDRDSDRSDEQSEQRSSAG